MQAAANTIAKTRFMIAIPHSRPPDWRLPSNHPSENGFISIAMSGPILRGSRNRDLSWSSQQCSGHHGHDRIWLICGISAPTAHRSVLRWRAARAIFSAGMWQIYHGQG
jgi:hypothetical protein